MEYFSSLLRSHLVGLFVFSFYSFWMTASICISLPVAKGLTTSMESVGWRYYLLFFWRLLRISLIALLLVRMADNFIITQVCHYP